MDNQYEQDYRIVIKELAVAIIEKAGLILVITLISMALGWSIAKFLIPPKYEASINMIVNTRGDISMSVTNDNISSAQNLVDTYAIIIKSNTVLNKVISDISLNLTYKELYEMVSVNAIDNTQVMKIAVQGSNPEVSEQIALKIADIAPDIVVNAVEAGSCKVVSDIYVESDPVFPDVSKITVLSGIMGAVICLALLVLKELMNDFIVDDGDAEKKLGLPVLAIIPNVEE